jgi:outer membrane protein OmpA-like peptidoglycan-associated protein
MSFHFRSISLTFVVALGFSSLTSACKENKSAPEAAPFDAVQLTKSYQELKPKVESAMSVFASLRKGLDEIPQEFPGAAELREQVGSGEEVLGVLDFEMRSYAEAIDAAKKAGNQDELAALDKRLASTAGTLAEANKRGGELLHKVSALNALAAHAKEVTEAYKRALPGGFEVKGKETGFEQQLIAFIEDKAKKVDRPTWFNFDRLAFDSGSTSLDLETSRAQLQNLTEILKAYPAVKLKVGGYTDNTGSPSVNRRLSLERAQAVQKALVELSVPANRLEAEGYGPAHPLCPANDTEFCKGQNRRIAVRVLAK